MFFLLTGCNNLKNNKSFFSSTFDIRLFYQYSWFLIHLYNIYRKDLFDFSSFKLVCIFVVNTHFRRVFFLFFSKCFSFVQNYFESFWLFYLLFDEVCIYRTEKFCFKCEHKTKFVFFLLTNR